MASLSISMFELVEVIGQVAAYTLCKRWGGVGVYVPQDPSKGQIPEAIGSQAARKLSGTYGGNTLYLPNEVSKPKPKKGRIIELLMQGKPPRQIALQMNVTEQWVRILKRQIKE